MLLPADDDAMSRRLTATITTVVIRFHFEKNGSEKHSSRIRSILILLYECVWKNLMAFVFPFSCFPHVIKFPWVHSIKKTAGVSHRQRECNNQICFRTSKFVMQTKHRPYSQMYNIEGYDWFLLIRKSPCSTCTHVSFAVDDVCMPDSLRLYGWLYVTSFAKMGR